MAADPYEKIHPDVVPCDSEIAHLISRHNRAVSAANRMEGLMERWMAGDLPSVSMDEVSCTREEIAQQWRVAVQIAARLDRLGYDPHDYCWGQYPPL